MTCSIHEWNWKGTDTRAGARHEVFHCGKCPCVKVVTTQVLDSPEEYAEVYGRTWQQKLADEIEREVMNGKGG